MGDCFLMGHGGYSLPKLNPNYPEDVILTSYNADAAFQVVIAKNGRPKKYTYKWYFSEDEGASFKEVSSGQDKDTLLISGYNGDQEYQVYCEITNKKGTVKSRVAKMSVSVPQPFFTYMVSGVNQADNPAYVVKDNWNTDNWKLSFLQSGDLTFINCGNGKKGMDIFAVGGGGGGGGGYLSNHSYGGGGGGGGRTKTLNNTTLSTNINYSIVIGAGGKKGSASQNGSKGDSSQFKEKEIKLLEADGGSGGISGSGSQNGGSGGSGGGGGGFGQTHFATREDGTKYITGYTNRAGGSGGTNGAGGSSSDGTGGSGLDDNTKEFNDSSSTMLYSGGGAGGYGMSAYLHYSDYEESLTKKGGKCWSDSSTTYGGGASGSNANWYGCGGGGGNFKGTGGGGGIETSGGNGYQGIIIIRNHQQDKKE